MSRKLDKDGLSTDKCPCGFSESCIVNVLCKVTYIATAENLCFADKEKKLGNIFKKFKKSIKKDQPHYISVKKDKEGFEYYILIASVGCFYINYSLFGKCGQWNFIGGPRSTYEEISSCCFLRKAVTRLHTAPTKDKDEEDKDKDKDEEDKDKKKVKTKKGSCCHKGDNSEDEEKEAEWSF